MSYVIDNKPYIPHSTQKDNRYFIKLPPHFQQRNILEEIAVLRKSILTLINCTGDNGISIAALMKWIRPDPPYAYTSMKGWKHLHFREVDIISRYGDLYLVLPEPVLLKKEEYKPEERKENDIMANKFCVTDVITHNNRVVIVKFSDGSFTKSVCSANDKFDLDVGITICVLKRLLDVKNENPTRRYNNLIRDIHKMMDKRKEEKEELLRAKKERREKEEKRQKKRKSAREAQRNEFIQDVSNAISKAICENDISKILNKE